MSTDDARQPNILFIMPDQMRGDCLSLERHPCLLTPNMDAIGFHGVHFSRAYTTCASCIPARRSLLTGQYPATNGMVGFQDGLTIRSPTLPAELHRAGYQTTLVGRHMHQFPYEEAYGYDRQVLASTYVRHDEYSQALESAFPGSGGVSAHGVSNNGWVARPWMFPEPFHPTNWVVQKSREQLARHPEAGGPLFLTTSFYAPHPPLIPPAFYLDRYLRASLPPAAIGHWATRPANDALGWGVDSHHTCLTGEALRSAQAGYFGLINQIDDQLFWLIEDFKGLSRRLRRPWLIVLTTDHGEMLGDHYYFRKCEPYEGSSRIPFLIQGSPELGFRSGRTCASTVSLEDLMPTLLDLAGGPIPDGIDGRSLVPVLRGEADSVREWLHAEHAPCYDNEQAYHMLTDGEWKYIWRPASGAEQLFHLGNDPQELTDLAAMPGSSGDVARWRRRLMDELRDRPEGFTDGRALIPGRPYPAILKR